MRYTKKFKNYRFDRRWRFFAAGFLHGQINNLSIKESLQKGTGDVFKNYSENWC